jgi:alkanesulfonate monooxygenase SsuD/methylene tetrahydromethanopterin reductase-like flavin-dependent oxidoreductase (luciferase family)
MAARVMRRKGNTMIRQFDSSYAGHIDLENVGYLGTPVNDRRYTNEQLATAHYKVEEQAKAMDRLGFGALWMAEHHFQPEGTECLPNIIMLAVHLTHLTKRLKFHTGFNITPMWHPLRLAEDFAVADVLTKGRVVFGVGRGYHTREVETFGAPLLDQNANRELFEEQVDIIFKAFHSERFSHKGRHYTLPPEVPYRGYTLKDLTLVPRPLRQPVECWQPIQSGSARALDFMVKHGIQGVIGGGSAEGGAQAKIMADWQAAHERAGIQIAPGERMAIGFQFHIAKSKEQAIKEAAVYYEENMKMFGELRLVRALTDQQIEAMRDPRLVPNVKLPRIEDAVAAGGFLAGTPDDIIEQLKALEKRYPGLNRVTVAQPLGLPLSLCLEQLEWFSKGVMPAFNLN